MSGEDSDVGYRVEVRQQRLTESCLDAAHLSAVVGAPLGRIAERVGHQVGVLEWQCGQPDGVSSAGGELQDPIAWGANAGHEVNPLRAARDPHIDVQCVQQARGVVVAAHHDDGSDRREFAQRVAGPGDVLGGRAGAIEQVAGMADQVRTEPTGHLDDLGDDRVVVRRAGLAVQGRAQMPVGGVQ